MQKIRAVFNISFKLTFSSGIFFQFEEEESGRDCVLECGPDKTCYPETCCAVRKKNEKGGAGGPEFAGVICSESSLGTSIRQRSNGSGIGGASSATPAAAKQGSTAGSGVNSSGEPMQENGPMIVESTAI